MNPIRRLAFAALLGTGLAATTGCTPSGGEAGEGSTPPDTSFAALQARGQQAMGVDQYTSTHLFDALPDGGRIELQRDVDDAAGVSRIRAHLQELAGAFRSGDFGTPAFVHMREVPGTRVMAERREAITYTYRDLPRGGELRMATSDPEALRAIHEFMAFQREDHRAGGMEHAGMDHGSMHGDSSPSPRHRP